MKSAWIDRDAQALVERYAGDGVGTDLALRVYTTRLLGRDPKLVLHGGGNTSVKTAIPDLLGEATEVICIKGSGADMADIEPAGLPAVRLDRLRKLRSRATLTDEDMVRVQRENLLDPAAPNPSVETLLHAFLPHKFVDHTHSTAVLSLVDQPDGEAICAEVYDGRASIVPYIMPGFALAQAAADVFDQATDVEGLILHKHGIFTFGDTAREAYERMIDLVTRAEERLARNRKAVFVTAQLPQAIAPRAAVAPLLRGAASLKDAKIEGAWRRLILDFRATPAVLDFVNGAEVARYSQAGVVTPDHTIRTKNWPLLVPAPADGKLDDFSRAAREAVAAFIDNYQAYFARNNARVGGIKKPLDPLPRVALVPGLGLFGLGRSKKEARVAADLAECAIETITDAEAIGRFEVDPRSRHVRHGILVARAGEARRRQGTAARRPDRRDHRCRRHHRIRNGQGVRRRRRRGRAARYRRGRHRREGQGDRRRGARGPLRRDRRGVGHCRLRQDRRNLRRRRYRWCRTPARRGRAASAKSTKRRCARVSN